MNPLKTADNVLGDRIGFVHLVDRPLKDVALKAVNAARISYNKQKDEFDEKDERLVDYLIKNGHTCYDSETEVLTSEGFVPWPMVTLDHELAAVDPDQGEMIGFEKPKRLVEKEYEGKMFSLETRDVSMKVTPNHNLYCSLSSTQEKRSNPEFGLFCANDVWKKPLRLMSSAFLNLQLEGTDKPLSFFKFLGFYVGDGAVVSANRIGFNLKKQRKKEYLRSLLDELGFQYSETTNSEMVTKFYVHVQNAREEMKPYGFCAKSKTLPDSFLKLSQGRIESVLDGLRNSDGSQKRNTWIYTTCSRSLANKIQALGAINGTPFSLCENERGMFILQARTRSKHPRVNDTEAAKIKQVPYRGIVYCAEISTGLLVVRRNNKVHLSGNSPFRHSFYTFHIKAPLFVFRQWWKHQVGATWAEIYIDTDSGNSWNEISGRYVWLEPEFYMPEVRWQDKKNKQGSVSDDTKDLQKDYWEGAMRQMTKHLFDAYQSYINAGIAKEVARMILPVSTYSEAYWTVSLQAIMHFLKLRLDDHAQPEIRRYAEGIKELIGDDLNTLGVNL